MASEYIDRDLIQGIGAAVRDTIMRTLYRLADEPESERVPALNLLIREIEASFREAITETLEELGEDAGERVPHPHLTPICKNCAFCAVDAPGMLTCPQHNNLWVQPYETCDQFNPKRTGDR
jgi:hypothetical protein